MAKKAKKKASARRRSKTSPRDLAPRRKGSQGGAGSMLPPRVKWEMSELDAFKS